LSDGWAIGLIVFACVAAVIFALYQVRTNLCFFPPRARPRPASTLADSHKALFTSWQPPLKSPSPRAFPPIQGSPQPQHAPLHEQECTRVALGPTPLWLPTRPSSAPWHLEGLN
jgi:hypothetical protein